MSTKKRAEFITQAGYYILDGWAGIRKYPVEIVGETPKKYRCILLQDGPLAGRNRWGKAGQIVLIPKSAIRLHEAK